MGHLSVQATYVGAMHYKRGTSQRHERSESPRVLLQTLPSTTRKSSMHAMRTSIPFLRMLQLCQVRAGTEGEVRLQPGSGGSGGSGVLEVFHAGAWGTVCDTNRFPDDNDFTVSEQVRITSPPNTTPMSSRTSRPRALPSFDVGPPVVSKRCRRASSLFKVELRNCL